MAKDPAFLFYPGDWDGGTKLFTRHEKGAYIDLLTAQFHCHDCGGLLMEEIRMILGVDFRLWDLKLKRKFTINSGGKFFNQKLFDEIEKRRAYVKSRSTNRKGKEPEHMNNHMNEHMKVHMENEIEIENRNGFKERGPGKTIEGFTDSENRNYNQALSDRIWIEGICMKYGIELLDCENYLKSFLGDLHLDNELEKDYKDIRVHFRRWVKIQIDKAASANSGVQKSKTEIKNDKFEQRKRDILQRSGS